MHNKTIGNTTFGHSNVVDTTRYICRDNGIYKNVTVCMCVHINTSLLMLHGVFKYAWYKKNDFYQPKCLGELVFLCVYVHAYTHDGQRLGKHFFLLDIMGRKS